MKFIVRNLTIGLLDMISITIQNIWYKNNSRVPGVQRGAAVAGSRPVDVMILLPYRARVMIAAGITVDVAIIR